MCLPVPIVGLIDHIKVKHQGSKRCNNEAYIIATAVVILVAGYDTTANTMGFMYYMLALNPGKTKMT